MPTERPIACSLTATEMPGRLAEMAAIGQSGLLAVETENAHAVLRFQAGAEIRERLEGIVDAESQCCAFLGMELRDEPGAVVLIIDAPEGAQPVVDELVAAFSDREPAA